MADRKIFAGPRIRRLRTEKNLTQSGMAQGLGISPSYLNLIERNQRPLTVQLLLKLSSIYQIDPNDLQGEPGGSVTTLKEVFSDPLLAGELPGDHELFEATENTPNIAAAMTKLYRAYQEQNTRLADLSELLARTGHAPLLSERQMPIDTLRETLEKRPNFFPDLEEEAESFLRLIGPGEELAAALKSWLKSEHGVTVRRLPIATMPNWRRRYDRHSQRLFLSERLSAADELREIAMECASLRMHVAMTATIDSLDLKNDEAKRLARFELSRYAAHAIMMPYSAFYPACVRARYDIDILRSHFSVSYEQAANRVTTLARTSMAGVPFFMLEVDNAGHHFRRAGAQGFPRQRFGGRCPKLSVHGAFAQPGHIIVEIVEMPDGAEFLTISRTLEGLQGTFMERPRRTAILLGCDIAFKDEIVYGDALPASTAATDRGKFRSAVPVGPACRLCERQACLARAEPPVTRPLGLDEMVTGLSAFDFR